MNDVPQEHVTEEVPCVLCRMALYEHVQVAERRVSISDTCVRICNVEGANELAVIDKLNFLMVPLEELGDATLKDVQPPVSKWVVPDYDSACLLKFGDEVLLRVEVEIVDDEVDGDAAFGRVRHLLQRDARNRLVVHVIRCYADAVLSLVHLVPEQVPKAVIVLVDTHSFLFRCRNSWLDHFFLLAA